VPSFVSSGLILAVCYLPLRPYAPVLAAGFTSGVMLGYAAYMFVHHATHHFKIEPGDWLYEARLRHMTHHYREGVNFGVSTASGTACSARWPPAASAQPPTSERRENSRAKRPAATFAVARLARSVRPAAMALWAEVVMGRTGPAHGHRWQWPPGPATSRAQPSRPA